MTGAAAAFAISLVAALAGMFPAVMIFRWLKTGVRSQFIPDRKQLKDQVRTVGAGSAALVGLLAASAACMPLIPAEERNAGGVFSAAVFCVMLFLAGFADDWLTDIKGYAAGLRPGMRIVFTGVCGLVFSNLYLAFGGNTVVTLPFAQGAVRINGFFCPVVTLLTVTLCEASRLCDMTEGVCAAREGIALFCAAAAAAFSAETQGTAFFLAGAGAATAAFYMTRPPALMKLGLSGRYLFSGAVLAGCVISGCERYIPFLAAAEILSALAFPADRLVYRLFKKHIFLRLPADAHLKACGWSDNKITAFFAALAVVFCGAAVAGAVMRARAIM